MPDREWFEVHTPSGARLMGSDEFPNREAAATFARSMAEESSTPLTLVRFTRREIKVFRRSVSVVEEDPVASPSATPVS